MIDMFPKFNPQPPIMTVKKEIEVDTTHHDKNKNPNKKHFPETNIDKNTI